MFGNSTKANDFIRSLPEKPGAAREARIVDAARAGLFAPLTWAKVRAEHEGRVAVLEVAADALSVGDGDARVRVNVSHTGAQQIADLLEATLPTARICDLAYAQAAVRLRPQIQRWDARSMNTSRMVLHSQAVDAELAGRASPDALVRDVGKDWVLSNRLVAHPDRGINYGWHSASAPYRPASGETRVWQPVGHAHHRFHVDYSQVLCLVRRRVVLDGVERDLDELLTSVALCGLVSHEGVLHVTRHPAVARATRSVATSRGPRIAHDPTSAPADDHASLPPGMRALRVAQQELALGVKEVPSGSNTGPRVREYLRGCVRDRVLADGNIERFNLRLAAANWCAAFASWCAFADARPDEVPHHYRASVAELWRDAVRSGAARPTTYTPEVGDLVIFAREGNDPRRGGIGHVGRVLVAPDAGGHYETIEGNSGNKVSHVRRKLGDCVGWIACNHAPARHLRGDELSAAARLIDLAGAMDGRRVARAPTTQGRFETLRDEYARLFAACVIRASRVGSVDKVVDRIVAARSRYEAVQSKTGVPWYFTAIVHSLEGGLRFGTHLHNGDPLTGRTVHVPKGRPLVGTPPFTWEESAVDALRMKGLPAWLDWSAPGILFKLESFNGFGYRNRHPPIPSPYLWSFTEHYTRGKYVKDGVFDPNAVSAQCGGAAVLLRLIQRGFVQLAPAPPVVTPPPHDAPRAPRMRDANAPALACVEDERVFRVGDADVTAVRRVWGAGGEVHLNVHDDENTSVAAAEAVLARHGGVLIELRHGGGRRVTFTLRGRTYSFDPNRVFSDEGAADTVRPSGSKAAIAAARDFGRALLEAFALTAADTLVALHNNTPGAPLTVRSYVEGKFRADAAKVHVSTDAKEDDFFLVTTLALFESLAARGFNVVLQNNATHDDGSLSVYAGRHGIRYVNVEARHGRLAEQTRMLEAALDAVSTVP